MGIFRANSQSLTSRVRCICYANILKDLRQARIAQAKLLRSEISIIQGHPVKVQVYQDHYTSDWDFLRSTGQLGQYVESLRAVSQYLGTPIPASISKRFHII